MSKANQFFEPLPIEEWEETKNLLHIFMQIIGKIRMELFPKKNHWWHVTLFVTPRGITTRPIPYENGIFEIQMDLIDHKLLIISSNGSTKEFGIDNLSVSEFYKTLLSNLSELGVVVKILDTPYDLPFSKIPFADDTAHRKYDREYVTRFWNILIQVSSVFEEYRGKFIGKSTPVHLYWHHMDLALTRFSGNEAPPFEGGTNADKEAYSHEVISFGFWAGDENVRAPAFYSYTYPEPKRLGEQVLKPEKAFWNTDTGSAMAILMYDDILSSDNPRKEIMNFLESSYSAGVKTAGWDEEKFKL